MCVDYDAEALVIDVSPVLAVDIGFVVLRLDFDLCGSRCLNTSDRDSCGPVDRLPGLLLTRHEARSGLGRAIFNHLSFTVLAK